MFIPYNLDVNRPAELSYIRTPGWAILTYRLSNSS